MNSQANPERIESVSFVGAGHMAESLSRSAVSAGLTVNVSNSRGPQALKPWVRELSPSANAMTPREAVAAGDVVVLAIPFGSFEQLPSDLVDGKALIDLTNYYPGMYAPQPLLDTGAITSSELLQRHFPGARVVKAFNTIAFQHITNLARPSGAPDRTAIPVAADDTSDLELVSGLLDDLGFDALAAGTLADSWRFEPGSPAFVNPYLTRPGAPWLSDVGRPMPSADLKTYIDAARR